MTAITKVAVHAPLPFRLRTALGVLLLGIGVTVALPRVQAAYRLYRSVSKVADYGLCMAGPTGALAIREDPARFRALVRRRLVAAAGNSSPFEKCASLAGQLTSRVTVEGAHRAQASSFLEWGGGAATRNLNELYNDLPDLEALALKSYPFCRKPLSELVKPSLGAEEAVHPSDPVVPSPVRGLRLAGAVVSATVETPRGSILMLSDGQEPWAVRSRDQGHSWLATSAWQSAVDGFANRCVGSVGGLSYAVANRESGRRSAILVKDGQLGEPMRRELSAPGAHIARLVCDETGAVVMTSGKQHGDAQVWACSASSSGCREVILPPLARLPDAHLDVARIAHTIVVAISKEGLVRVITSRDEGVTMTPLSLVFDARDAGTVALYGGALPRLVALGKRLLLILTATDGASVGEGLGLVSEDFGASFRKF
jgi:hypothetical protein